MKTRRDAPPLATIIDPDRDRANDTARSLEEAGIDVAGHAGYGVPGLRLAAESRSNILFVYIDEPHRRPFAMITEFAQSHPDAHIIAHAASWDSKLAREAMFAGARDFIIGPLSPDSIGRSLDKLFAGGTSTDDAPLGTVVTVFGAKGGIGKTTIATNMAVSLAHDGGHSVALVDLDTRFGDVATALDMPVAHSIADAARDISGLDAARLAHYYRKHDSGVDVLAAPLNPGDWRNIIPGEVTAIIRLLAETHDFVILDTPGAFNETVATALETCQMLLLVTTLEMASVKDTVVALELLESHLDRVEDRVRVVLNRHGMNIGTKPQEIEEALGRTFWAKIAEDKAVIRNGQTGRSIVTDAPSSKAAKDIRALATKLAGGSAKQPRANKSGASESWLPRLFGFMPFGKGRVDSPGVREQQEAASA